MTIGLGLLGITGKTAFSFVGQRGLRYFDDHPFLEVRALIADDPADVGRTFAEVVPGRWLLDEPVPDRWKDLVMVGIDGPALESAGVQLVLSALPGPHARQLDPQLAALGLPVVSESAGLRLEAGHPAHRAGHQRRPPRPGVGPEDDARLGPRLHRVQPGVHRGHRGARREARRGRLRHQLVRRDHDAGAFRRRAHGRAGAQGHRQHPAVHRGRGAEAGQGDAQDPGHLSRRRHRAVSCAARAATCTRVPVRDGHTASITLGLERAASTDEVAGVSSRPIEVGRRSCHCPRHLRSRSSCAPRSIGRSRCSTATSTAAGS